MHRFGAYRVEGLSPGKDYQFRVTAANLYGKSEPCEPVQAKTDEVETKKRPGYECKILVLNARYLTDVKQMAHLKFGFLYFISILLAFTK